MLFVQYPKCSTCRKAKKWLDEHDINYESSMISTIALYISGVIALA